MTGHKSHKSQILLANYEIPETTETFAVGIRQQNPSQKSQTLLIPLTQKNQSHQNVFWLFRGLVSCGILTNRTTPPMRHFPASV